jgi:hypothetical protein
LYQEASFAAVVVLPDPWRPANSTTVDDLDDLLTGSEALREIHPDQLVANS